jgi:hypothetical protein
MRSPQTRLRAVAALVVAGTLAVAASAVAQGLEPSPVRPVSDAAFRPVVLDRVLDRDSTAPAPPPAIPAPRLQPIADAQAPSAPPDRPQPKLPEPKPTVVTVAQSLPHSISGRASWYCNSDDPSVPYSICHNAYPDGPGFDAYAAAGPGLRAALGSGWRNTVVLVCGRRCVEVRLVDWCKCTGGSVGAVKLIDLYQDVYARTGGNVTIRW